MRFLPLSLLLVMSVAMTTGSASTSSKPEAAEMYDAQKDPADELPDSFHEATAKLRDEVFDKEVTELIDTYPSAFETLRNIEPQVTLDYVFSTPQDQDEPSGFEAIALLEQAITDLAEKDVNEMNEEKELLAGLKSLERQMDNALEKIIQDHDEAVAEYIKKNENLTINYVYSLCDSGAADIIESEIAAPAA